MPCHIAKYKHIASGKQGWALVDNAYYAIDCDAMDTRSFLERGKSLALEMAANLSAFTDRKIKESEIELLSPISAPCRILCQGSNYPQSRIETGMNPNVKGFNTLFHKSDASISDPKSDIVRPSHVKLLDYEVELGIVIGAEINQTTLITEDNIHQYVAGVVLAHDVTARDIQIPQGQYFKGKSYRTFCPVGPYLCLLESGDSHYLKELELTLSVNGDIRQRDNSKNLIFKPDETLSELSAITNLSPGDLLLTGSPGGGALSVPGTVIVKIMGLLPEALKWKLFVKRQAKNTAYLEHGDIVEAQIKSTDGTIDLGTQNNRVINA